jgi:hypothetical protein
VLRGTSQHVLNVQVLNFNDIGVSMGRSFSFSRLIRLWVLGLILMGSGAFAQADGGRTGPDAAEAYRQLMHLGQVALAKDAPQKAARAFARARIFAPTDLRAQLSLAEAYARQGQVARSEAFLKHLLRDPAQGDHVDAYLKALSKLQHRYPVVASASVAFLPSTNIANASSETVFDTVLGRFEIDGGGEETSGVGVELGARGTYRKPLGEGLSFEITAALNRIWYDAPELRYWRGRVTADVVGVGVAAQWRAGSHADRIYYDAVNGQSADRIALGAHGNWSQTVNETTRLTLSALAEYRKYLDKDSLSGPYASLGAGWSKALGAVGAGAPRGATLSWGGSVERSKPSLDYHRYWGATARVGYAQNLTDTLRGGVSMSATLKLYDADFAAVDYARRDEIYRFGVSLSDSRIKLLGSTPKLSCGYKVQSSNIALYTSSTTDCRLGWSYRF